MYREALETSFLPYQLIFQVLCAGTVNLISTINVLNSNSIRLLIRFYRELCSVFLPSISYLKTMNIVLLIMFLCLGLS